MIRHGATRLRPSTWPRALVGALAGALGWVALGLPMPAGLARRLPDQGALTAGWGRWWRNRQRALRLLVLLALGWSSAYIAWRVGWSWRHSNPVLWGCLLVAELYGVWNLATLSWLTWEVNAPARTAPAPAPSPSPAGTCTSVDVYVCTYDESTAVLEATLSGCSLLRYPHTTWLLDDGGRDEVAQLARDWGVEYMTRRDKSHAKAGNINHALPLTDGELVFVLDADHVPLPDALDRLVGYLEDPTVALVQTPHDFSNHDSIQHYSLGRHEQSVFFSAICAGKDRHNAAFWCGSGALIRRAALLSVGGVATETIAEDFHTTIKLHSLGWRTHYDGTIVAQGLAPHDLASYLLQRDRWARGNLAVFTTPESPLRARGLTARQRMSYFASLTGYLAGPVRLLLLAVLTAVLWSGALPLRIAPLALAGLWAPATVLMVLAGSALCRGAQSSGESTHYELCTAEIFTRALRCVLRPGRTTFKVTPKEGVDRGGWEAVRQFRVLILFSGLLACGLVLRALDDFGVGFLPAMHGFAAWFVPLLGLFEFRRVNRTLAYVARRKQLRGEYRTPLTVAAVIVPNGEAANAGIAPEDESVAAATLPAHAGERTSLLGRMRDVTGSGVGFEVSRPLAPGTRASLTVQLPSVSGEPTPARMQIEVHSCVAHAGSWRIGASIVGCEEADRRALLAYCSVVWPYMRLRGEGALAAMDAPIHTALVEEASAG
jgi:cellulose synthase (UDP-forming)